MHCHSYGVDALPKHDAASANTPALCWCIMVTNGHDALQHYAVLEESIDLKESPIMNYFKGKVARYSGRREVRMIIH